MKTFREKIIKYGTFLIVGIMPILYLGNSWFIPHLSPKTFFFYGAVEIIFVFWLYIIIIDKSYRLDRKTLLFFIPIVLYLLWMTVTGITGVNPEMSFWSSIMRGTGLLTLYHELALLFIIVSLFKREGFNLYSKFLYWFLGGAFLLTLSIWLGNEGFNIPLKFLQDTNGGGMVGNSSIAATYLIFTIFFGLFLIFSKEIIRKQKILIGIVLLSILFSPLFLNIYKLFLSGQFNISARGAMIGIGVGVIITILGYLVLSKKKFIKWIGILSICISLFVFLFGWINLMNPTSTLHQKFISSATESRFIFWDISQQAIKARPILGWGTENYMVVYQKYFNPQIYMQPGSTEVWNDRAHNIFFDIGVSAGWFAIFLYVLFLISIIYAVYKAYIIGNISRLQTGILWGLLVGYVFQNLFVFDSPLSLLGLFVFAGLAFAVANKVEKIDKEDKDNKYIMVKSYKFLIICGLSIALIFSWTFFVLKPAKKIINLSSVTNMFLNKRADHYVDLLNGSSIGNGWEVGSIAHNVYITYSRNNIQIKSDPKVLAYVEKDIEKLTEYLEVISKKEVYDYRLYLSMARLYNMYISLTGKKNDFAFNQHILEIEYHAKELSPNDPQVDWEIAQTLIFMGDNKGVEQALLHAISLAPYIKISYQMLIDFAKSTGDTTLLQDTLINAKQNIPGFSYDI